MKNTLLKETLELMYQLKEFTAGDISDIAKERMDEVITKLEAAEAEGNIDKQQVLETISQTLSGCRKVSNVIAHLIDRLQ